MFKERNFSLDFLLKLMFIPIFYELVIGGSGHYLEIGPITLRMVFYIIAILISLVYYSFKKVIKKDVIIIVGSLTLFCSLSSMIGYFNHASIGAILEDFKPISFIYVILYFSLVVKNIDDILMISSILKIGSIILAVVYISVVLLLYFGKIDFLDFYSSQNQIGEIMFRNDTLFFYKGFMYLCVGFFFYLFSKGKFKFFALLLLFTSIVLTLTRGFILFTVLIFLYYIIFFNKNIFLKWAIFFVGFFSVIYFIPFLVESLGDRSDSDVVRFSQVNQVISAINPLSFIIGHGFGIGVPIRPIHMELSFLEIFHKQGIIGVSFWIGLYLHIFIIYFKITNKKYKVMAVPFLLSVVFVLLQSTTNPFMNNPIGLTMILITIVVFSKLLDFEKKEIL